MEEDEKTKSKPLGVKPLSQRMSVAYDNIVKEKEGKELSPKYVVALGKLVLEIEQVKNNLQFITQEIRTANKRYRNLMIKNSNY